ncbi:MAG: DegQ family serine endoprotease [Thermodesulfobacteriota bacterium]
MKIRSAICACLLFLLLGGVGLAQAELPEFSNLAKDAGPAVVNISTVKVVETSQRLNRFFQPFEEKSPLNEFFKEFFGEMPQQKRRQNSLGSGFIISQDGYVVTNNHVIARADEIKVTLQGGEDSIPAEVVGRDPETDLALLKIDTDKKLPVLEFGDSQELDVGQWVVAIGNPFGLDHTVTAGIISAKGRVIGAGPYDNFLQTDASINPGNSGGPLLNLEGKVVGINTAIVSSGQGIGFAIPSNMAREVIEQLQEYQKVRRGWLGVTIQDVDKNTAKALGLPKAKGALIASVQEGDPAHEAGLRPGDVIVEVDGEPVRDAGELTRRIGNMQPGQEVEIVFWRKGQERSVQLTLGERDLETARRGEKQEPGPERADFLGMQVKQVNEEEARSLDLPAVQGLLVTDVEEGSPAAQADVRRGDVILEANGQSVNQTKELQEVLEGDAQDKGVVMLLISRQGQNLFRTIPMPE